MNDVVISARIPFELMDKIKKLGKPKSEIVNEALQAYISKNTASLSCIHQCIQKKSSREHQSTQNIKLQETRGNASKFMNMKKSDLIIISALVIIVILIFITIIVSSSGVV